LACKRTRKLESMCLLISGRQRLEARRCLFDLDGTLTTLQVLARGVLARVRCIF
jgi:hypothetical protein